MQMRQFTLFQLNQLVRTTLDQHLEPSYWVVAEIGEFRINQKGHCYMEFVEKQQERMVAKMRANLWAYDFYNLNSLFLKVTGKPLGAGMKILAKVMIQFHEIYGLSLLVKDLDPNYTLGERARQKQLIIERLSKEGTINKNRQISLPLVPQRIAVVSSKSAAGYGDFIDHLANNIQGYHFEVRLFEATMQGEEAVTSITRAIKKILQQVENFDILAIIRGGGSQIDLDCFDSYVLATEIASSKLPVVTGIGHQRDDTVADLVAHTRLKTPTAVAEFFINGVASFDEQLNYQLDRIAQQTQKRLDQQGSKLLNMLSSLVHGSKMAVQQNLHELALIKQQLESSATRNLNQNRKQIQEYQYRLIKQSNQVVEFERQRLQVAQAKLTLADPEHILKRGYSLTYLNGKIVKPNTVVEEGDEIETTLHQRTVSSKVTKVTNERRENKL